MEILVKSPPSCVAFEDEFLLVVDKPAGMNTHAPSPFAGQGIYEWLRDRERLWGELAIIHRLDKETSGILLFSKSRHANRSLTEQFAQREVSKEYEFLTHIKPAWERTEVKGNMRRVGDRYEVTQQAGVGDYAVTQLEYLGGGNGKHRILARPLTGRTHQIRVHAQSLGIPILGDTLYQGAPAARLCLHSKSLSIRHPFGKGMMRFESAVDFTRPTWAQLRRRLVASPSCNLVRWIHGAADGQPGFFLEQWGENWLCISEEPPAGPPLNTALRLAGAPAGAPVWFKRWNKKIRESSPDAANPEPLRNAATPPAPFEVVENGVRYEARFDEGYSTGLFPDQRDNRLRLRSNWIGAGFPLFPGGLAGRSMLNTFSYTCGFSVCAALAGMATTSLDLSKKYLDWGGRNFALNQIPLEGHDFIYGDVFDWCKRLAKKGRLFDCVVLDPPTFSQSKEHGVFRAEKDFEALITLILPLLAPNGILLASTNAARLEPADFLYLISRAASSRGRRVLKQLYCPQPPDFPVSREEPAYFKSAWSRIS